MIVPVLGGRNGNNTQTNTTTSSGVVPVLQGGKVTKGVVPVHTQASALSVQKPQQQQNFLQQSSNFLNGVYKGAVGEVGSILNSQPVKSAEKTASKVINGITVKLIKPALKTPVGKEVKDFYDVTTQNPNYEKPSGIGIGDLAARGIQNPQVAGAEGAAVKGFSKAGAAIGGVVNAGLGYLANKNNNIKTTPQDVLKNAAIGSLLGGVAGHAAEKQIKPTVKDILKPGIHKPQDLVGEVMKHNLETTPEGKKVIQLAHQAQQQGLHIEVTPQKLTKFDTPEIIKARQEQLSIPSTHTDTTPERQALREKIATDLYKNGGYADAKKRPTTEVKSEKRADIVTGLPASGKNSAISDPLVKEHGSILIDSDEAKTLTPESAGGKYNGAVHLESTHIHGELLNKALDQENNVVIPLVGKTAERVTELAEKLKREGYDVHLHHNEVSIDTAAKRAVERFNETGKFVDPNYILNEVGLKPNNNYDIIKKNKAFSTYEKYSNEVAKGEKPKLIEQGSNINRSGRSSDRLPNSSTGQETPGQTETSKVTPKVSKIAKEIEAKAVEKGFADKGFEKLAGYTPQTFKEQAKLTTDLINNHFDDFKAIIRGEKPLPKEINPSHLITAAEEYLKNNPEDTQTLQELAKSDIVTRTSEAAQTLGAARTREAYSPIELIKQLQDDRKATIQKRLGESVDKAVQKEVDKIKKVQAQIKKPDKYDWSAFISSIQC